jgi:Holliday junction resolvase
MPAKKPVVKEAFVERMLVRQVEALGGACLKVTTLGRRGFFDRLVILPGGRVVFVELKRPRAERLSVHQMEYMKLFKALDVEFAVVRDRVDIARLLSCS